MPAGEGTWPDACGPQRSQGRSWRRQGARRRRPLRSAPDFDFEADLTQHAQAYRTAAVANLFHANNVIHDVLWRYGFDDASGNFQVNNYGRGGAGGDYVRAEAADGSGINNANFNTPAADGNPPRMQMYLWPGNQLGRQNQVAVAGVGEFGAGWRGSGRRPRPPARAARSGS